MIPESIVLASRRARRRTAPTHTTSTSRRLTPSGPKPSLSPPPPHAASAPSLVPTSPTKPSRYHVHRALPAATPIDGRLPTVPPTDARVRTRAPTRGPAARERASPGAQASPCQPRRLAPYAAPKQEARRSPTQVHTLAQDRGLSCCICHTTEGKSCCLVQKQCLLGSEDSSKQVQLCSHDDLGTHYVCMPLPPSAGTKGVHFWQPKYV
ncbi:serine/arginine repetitive matrix protein 1-like [Meriones unguiculatus]|uniref:serine/arginine repetitive matrix protein 1-like n=1 Tax=Meriones unguiculatus TaxID=10047 RepID=UPI00293E83B3|nr:serine/arginine repetitive matrix protein 1-like [Meriones unguiculatus]